MKSRIVYMCVSVCVYLCAHLHVLCVYKGLAREMSWETGREL